MDSKAQSTSPVYYAFISYSRKDMRAARYIQKGLENFCYTSIPVQDKYKPKHPQFLRKIFRDKTDLSYKAPDYRQGLKLALDNSRYLVVICSGNSRRSKEVEREIEDFLSHPNHKESHVIPVVLNGHVGKKDNPLPRPLNKTEFLMRNLPVMRPEVHEREKDAWENALGGIIAYMTRAPREYVYNRFLKEKRKRFARILQWVSAVLICMLGLTCWAFHERNKAAMAQTLAENAQAAAERERDRTAQEKAIADKERARAEAESKKATELFEAGANFSRNIILDFNKELSYFSQATNLQQQLFSYMESYLNSMRGHSINEPKLLRLMMLTNIQLGNNAANRSEDEKALNFFQNAQTQAEHLLSLSPDDLSIQEYSVNIRHCVARIYTKTGKFTQAGQLLNQALEISKKIVQAAPADMRKRTPLCETYKYMGELLQRQNKTAEAIKMYVSFLNEEENRDADLPGFTNAPTADYLEFRLSLASACEHLASALAQSGEYKEAAAVCDKGQNAISPIISDSANNKYDKIKAYSPLIIPFHRQMATLVEQRADFNVKQGSYDFVLASLGQALHVREKLSNNDSFNVTLKLELASSYEKAGKACLQMKNVEKYTKFLRDAERLFRDIANSSPENRKLQETYFRFNTDLAMTHLTMNKPYDAVDVLELKLDYLKEKERDLCEYPYFYIELRKTYQLLAETYLRNGELEYAKTMFENSLRIMKEEEETEKVSADDLSLTLSTVRNSLAYLYAKEGRYHEASELYEKAYPILERAAANDPNNEALRRGLAMAKNTRTLLNKEASKIKQEEDTLKQVKSIPPPASLKGCGIKFDKITLEPGNFDIESYEVKGDKALVLISYSEEMPKDYYSCLLSAAKTVEEAEKRIPAEVVFTAKKGRVYTGYVNGSWSMSRIYHYEESSDLLPLRNCKIEITLPEEDAILDGKIAAPRSIPKNSRIEIKTDRRTLKYAIGEFAPNAYLCRYKPEEKTAKIELSLPSPDNRNAAESIHMALSGADDFKNIYTADAPLPRILFMEKTGKTYHGVFQGYLYLYKSAPMKEGQYESEDTLIQRETLQTITISLP